MMQIKFCGRGFETVGAVLCLGLVCLFLNAQSSAGGHSAQSLEGKQSFISNCGGCHGMDGRGGEHAPAIATEPSIRQLSDARLLQIIGDGIPSGGMPAFRSLGQRRLRLIVDYLRLLQGKPSAAELPGNPAHGRTLFFGAAKCSTCHMVRGVGGFLGPDLSDYALAHSVPETRQAILYPNRNLNPPDDEVVAVTRDGRKLIGIARNEDNFSLQLETPDGRLHLLAKSSLAALRHKSWSLMPADYKSKLSGSELNDLVSFLVSTAGQDFSRTRGKGRGFQPRR